MTFMARSSVQFFGLVFLVAGIGVPFLELPAIATLPASAGFFCGFAVCGCTDVLLAQMVVAVRELERIRNALAVEYPADVAARERQRDADLAAARKEAEKHRAASEKWEAAMKRAEQKRAASLPAGPAKPPSLPKP